jgi:hypothetical protein
VEDIRTVREGEREEAGKRGGKGWGSAADGRQNGQFLRWGVRKNGKGKKQDRSKRRSEAEQAKWACLAKRKKRL